MDTTGKHNTGFISKLKPPAFRKVALKSELIESLDVAAPQTVPRHLPGALRRRSKSFNDLKAEPLRKFTALPAIHAKAPLKSATNIDVRVLRRRSKSVVDLTLMRKPIARFGADKSAGTSVGKSTAKVAPKNANKNQTGIKRAICDKTEEPKAKVMRSVRIPPYDYKARFHHLEELHRKLKSDHETLKMDFTSYKDAQNEFEMQREQMHVELERLENANLIAERKLATLQSKNAEKQKANENYARVVSELNLNLIDNKAEIIAKESSLKTVRIDLERLQKDYKISREEIQHLKDNNMNINVENENRKRQNEQLQIEIDELKAEVERKDVIRQKLHNDLQDLKGNIRVFCRVRPPIASEHKPMAIIKCTDDTDLEIRRLTDNVSTISGKSAEVKQEFCFDRVFDENCTQADIFEELSQLVQSALDGYNVCVFAYGQTGSGKTYTMQGFDADDEGMIPRSLHVIFNYETTKKHLGWSITIQASFLEIYNETVKDLLNFQNKEHLEIFYNDGKGVSVKNLTIQNVTTYAELRKLMAAAHKNRTVAATDFNLHSSRSHAVTQIHITGIHDRTKSKLTSILSLVDLAGSESAKTSSRDRMAETKSINKSLSTLGTVINDLSAGKSHIPYRNSKLTFLLQSCLSGNSKTLMIAHIAPNDECYSESVSSLRFAAKVKSVKVTSRKNKTIV